MTQQQFEDLCFNFGVELDDVTSERAMAAKEVGQKLLIDKKDVIIYKIDVSANRYDLLCEEGLAMALRIYLGKSQPPKFVTQSPKVKILVRAPKDSIRPFVVCAVLRNI